jgi:hypothetical protein
MKDLPEIYWYLFWIGFVILAFRMAYLGGKHGFETRLKAIEVLRMYAEKGTEPPPAMMDQLAKAAFEHGPGKDRKDSRGGLLPSFIGFLFMACVAWAVHAWLASISAPVWQTAAATAAVAFFGFGAFGFLLAALFTRKQ